MPSKSKSVQRTIPGRRELRLLRSKVYRISKMLEIHLGIPSRAANLPPPMDMLIATILSQNTNDKNSRRAYDRLRLQFNDWSEVAAAPIRGITASIKCGGMARQKAPRIRETLREIKRLHGRYDLDQLRSCSNEEVMDALTSLNGIGVKTASCVLLFAMGRDVFPVDTHVHRLCCRLGLAPDSKNPEQTFRHMAPLVPQGKSHSLHTNLIRFGRMVCRAAKPACGACPLFAECTYPGRHANGSVKRVGAAADHDFMLLDGIGR